MAEYYVRYRGHSEELYHHGIKGMKWGVRRFQKKDGSLTSAGAKRYATVGDDELKSKKQAYKQAKKDYSRAYDSAYKYSAHHPISQWVSKKRSAKADEKWDDAIEKAKVANTKQQEYKQAKKEYKETNKEALAARRNRAIKIGAAAAGTALAAYGAYKVSKYVRDNRVNAGKKRIEQLAYLQRNINNTQSHVDPASKLYQTDQWKHAMESTINSRRSSIKGDRALYGDKAVKGRDAVKEAIYSSYESLVRGDWNKKMDRLK